MKVGGRASRRTVKLQKKTAVFQSRLTPLIIQIKIYMLFTGWEVRTGKIFSRGLKSGLRPKVEVRF